MIVTVKNISNLILSTDVGLLNPGITVSTVMDPARMYLASANLLALENKGYLTVSVLEETAANLASLATPLTGASFPAREPLLDTSGSMGLPSVLSVAGSDSLSGMLVLHKAFAGGATGPAADVVIYAAGLVPYKMRLIDAMFHTDLIQDVDDTMQLWSGAAASGNQLSNASSTLAAGVLRQAQAGHQSTLLVASSGDAGDGVNFTSVAYDHTANLISVGYAATSGGSTTVSVVGNAITVHPKTGALNSDVVTAIGASAAASALVTAVADDPGDALNAGATSAAFLTGGLAAAPLILSTDGLFLRLSDGGVGGSVTLFLRRE